MYAKSEIEADDIGHCYNQSPDNRHKSILEIYTMDWLLVGLVGRQKNFPRISFYADDHLNVKMSAIWWSQLQECNSQPASLSIAT